MTATKTLLIKPGLSFHGFSADFGQKRPKSSPKLAPLEEVAPGAWRSGRGGLWLGSQVTIPGVGSGKFLTLDDLLPTIGISPAWEEESPRRNPKSLKKSLEKVLGPSGPKSLKKVSGRVRKVSKKKPMFGLFRDFSDSPQDFFQTFEARGSEDSFETFFRLLGFRPGDSSSHAGEIPNLQVTTDHY